MQRLELNGMRDESGRVPAWEAEWSIFGPVENDPGPWPGPRGFAPLPPDAATAIPESVEIAGRRYAPVRARSVGGVLDLAAVLGCSGRFRLPVEGPFPIAWMMTAVHSPRAAFLPVAFGADWGTIWWVNGRETYHSREGNWWHLPRNSHSFHAPLKPGANLVVVRVVSGMGGWTVTLGRLAPRARPPRLRRAAPLRPAAGAARPPPAVAPGPGRYFDRAGLRIEERPGPVPHALSRRRARIMARHGVELHWIGVVDPTGSPYAPSAHLPARPDATPAAAERLRTQVREIHAHGMAALSWFPGTYCLSAAQAHPDWKTVPLAESPTESVEARNTLCVHSPYGEALIRFFVEAAARYDLDGFWIDGANWGFAERVGCVCAHCRRRFREAEGLDLPRAYDWDDPVFRRWVAWRYRAFMDYWGALAARLRRAHPHLRVALNHKHRLYGPWFSGDPIDLHSADVVVGSEAEDNFISAFHARVVCAYGKDEAEVWRGLHAVGYRQPTWAPDFQPLHSFMHHALAVMTAGAMPSFGTPEPGETLAAVYDALAALVNPRRPFVGGVREPYAALHLSQQAETFYFARRADRRHPQDYWLSVFGWHNLLVENQLLLDVAFDGHLTPADLSRYPVFVAPLSVALSDAQIARFARYVAEGGVLVAGPWFGARDAWGCPAEPGRVAELLGHAAEPPPSPDRSCAAEAPTVTVRRLGAGAVIEFAGNPGLAFHANHSPLLAREVGRLIRAAAPPRLDVRGPRGLNVGLYRKGGRLLLHLHNALAYSEAEAFEKPYFLPPRPARGVRVRLRGYPVVRARRVLARGAPALKLKRWRDGVEFVLPRLGWGDVIALEG